MQPNPLKPSYKIAFLVLLIALMPFLQISCTGSYYEYGIPFKINGVENFLLDLLFALLLFLILFLISKTKAYEKVRLGIFLASIYIYANFIALQLGFWGSYLLGWPKDNLFTAISYLLPFPTMIILAPIGRFIVPKVANDIDINGVNFITLFSVVSYFIIGFVAYLLWSKNKATNTAASIPTAKKSHKKLFIIINLMLIVFGLMSVVVNQSQPNPKTNKINLPENTNWFNENTTYVYNFKIMKTQKTYENVLEISYQKKIKGSEGKEYALLRREYLSKSDIDDFKYERSVGSSYSQKSDGIYKFYPDMFMSQFYKIIPKNPKVGDKYNQDLEYDVLVIEKDKEISVPAGKFKVFVIQNQNVIEYWNYKEGLIRFEYTDHHGNVINQYNLSYIRNK